MALVLSGIGLAFWGVQSFGVCLLHADNPRERRRARQAAVVGLVCVALALLNFGVLAARVAH